MGSFAFYFSILTLWALQVQFLLQIIINRIGVLMLDRKKAANLKYGVAVLITLINISVYCIWVRNRVMFRQETKSDSLTGASKTTDQRKIYPDQRRMGPMRESHLPYRGCYAQLPLCSRRSS